MENFRRYGLRFFLAGLIQSPILSLLDFSRRSETDSNSGSRGLLFRGLSRRDDVAADEAGPAEVSIRIFSAGEAEEHGSGNDNDSRTEQGFDHATSFLQSNGVEGAPTSMPSISTGADGAARSDMNEGDVNSASNTSSNYNGNTGSQRYEIQPLARWVEQVLPFSLLLFIIFIRQHLQGFLISFWITAVMIKLNDLLRKQTALKGERKLSVLVCVMSVLVLHVAGVYWWYKNDDLWYPLLMLPLRTIPPFWHAIFVIIVNDTMVRQAAMVLKCGLLVYYKSNKGRSYRKQGQVLTLVEYILLLYRALLPTPVWYRFFLNKEYGSLFSSLTTGLYLTFKLTSIVEKVDFKSINLYKLKNKKIHIIEHYHPWHLLLKKVQASFAALKGLSHKEVQYGSYATAEEVVAAGDLCAICQEKMHAPILLSCKHIFCDDCVSEWFERERTCPLCRAIVKPAELRSFSDGSTSLLFQLF